MSPTWKPRISHSTIFWTFFQHFDDFLTNIRTYSIGLPIGLSVFSIMISIETVAPEKSNNVRGRRIIKRQNNLMCLPWWFELWLHNITFSETLQFTGYVHVHHQKINGTHHNARRCERWSDIIMYAYIVQSWHYSVSLCKNLNVQKLLIINWNTSRLFSSLYVSWY